MYIKIILNDILKNKVTTLITTLFVTAASLLMTLALILTVNLSGSIDNLMIQAKTPHFLQMHSGNIDMGRLNAFANQNSDVDKFQVIELLNVDNSQIIINDKSLAKSVQDNSLSKQSEEFDYLLDMNGNIIEANNGEIYVPISYMKDESAKAGDKVFIHGVEFTVSGFLRDSQMNSLLASSKRFIISENDYAKMKDLCKSEYLIEFRLKDLGAVDSFEKSYRANGLEANGPTLTYSLFKTINAVSDGLMIAVILLVSLLVAAIALMCIRFTLLAKIEEDYGEIGVMKAIGMRVSDIKRIYLSKYAAMGLIGCILGFILALLLKGKLLENIRLYMGEMENLPVEFLVGIISTLLVYGFIIAYVYILLKQFQKISAAQAMRFENSSEKSKVTKLFSLSKNRFFNTNIFLGISDVITRKKLYATMLMIIIISSFIMLIPQNLHNTIAKESFITYMGIGQCDMRIDVQQTDNILGKATEIADALGNDKNISKYAMLTTKAYNVKTEENTEERIKIELGDHSVFPITYSNGTAPTKDNEIALSTLNAEELSKKIGDSITIITSSGEKTLTVCGIYSDITNGGKTAKATFNDSLEDVMWCVINAKLSDKSLIENLSSEYGEKFEFAKVSGVKEYVAQTFGSTISSVKTSSYVTMVAAVLLTALITLLFMKMLVSKDRHSIAVMKAIGFRNGDITIQYISRSVLILVFGVLFGTILANTLGEIIVGMIMSSFGAASFKFTINPLSAYVYFPIMLVGSALIATIIGTSAIPNIKISQHIKE